MRPEVAPFVYTRAGFGQGVANPPSQSTVRAVAPDVRLDLFTAPEARSGIRYSVAAVVNAGATNVSSIQFGLLSRTPAENAARLAAVKALQDKAALYADASGYHIRRLVNLSEGVSETAPPPRPLIMARMAAASTPPVEAGELKVRVDVTGEFELAH